MTDADRVALLVGVVRDRLLTIVGLLVIAGAAAFYVGVDVSVPRWLKLAAISGGLVGVPIGYWAGSFILARLPDPPGVYLVDLDAERRGSGTLVWFPRDQFRELTVTDGNGHVDGTHELHEVTPELFVGRSVDLEQMTVVGTWLGSVSDAELLSAIDAIREVRGDLQKRAKRGERIENQLWSIVRNATAAEVSEVVETFEDGALPSEDELTSVVDEALAEYGADDPIDDLDGVPGVVQDVDQEDETPDAVSEANGAGIEDGSAPITPEADPVEAGADD